MAFEPTFASPTTATAPAGFAVDPPGAMVPYTPPSTPTPTTPTAPTTPIPSTPTSPGRVRPTGGRIAGGFFPKAAAGGVGRGVGGFLLKRVAPGIGNALLLYDAYQTACYFNVLPGAICPRPDNPLPGLIPPDFTGGQGDRVKYYVDFRLSGEHYGFYFSRDYRLELYGKIQGIRYYIFGGVDLASGSHNHKVEILCKGLASGSNPPKSSPEWYPAQNAYAVAGSFVAEIIGIFRVDGQPDLEGDLPSTPINRVPPDNINDDIKPTSPPKLLPPNPLPKNPPIIINIPSPNPIPYDDPVANPQPTKDPQPISSPSPQPTTNTPAPTQEPTTYTFDSPAPNNDTSTPPPKDEDLDYESCDPCISWVIRACYEIQEKLAKMDEEIIEIQDTQSTHTKILENLQFHSIEIPVVKCTWNGVYEFWQTTIRYETITVMAKTAEIADTIRKFYVQEAEKAESLCEAKNTSSSEIPLQQIEIPIVKCEQNAETKEWEPKSDYQTITVIASTSETATAISNVYIQQAEQAKELCEAKNKVAIAAIPESWQVAIDGDRPQLIVLFAELKEDGKLGRSRYPISIPHYNKPQSFNPVIPDYKKGQYMAKLVLKDNSKLIVNAYSSGEAKRVIARLVQYINPDMFRRDSQGNPIKEPKIIERGGDELNQITVTATNANFFSKGRKDMNPDWVKQFR